MYNPLYPNDYNYLKAQHYSKKYEASSSTAAEEKLKLASRERNEVGDQKNRHSNFLADALRSCAVPSPLDASLSHPLTSPASDTFQSTVLPLRLDYSLSESISPSSWPSISSSGGALVNTRATTGQAPSGCTLSAHVGNNVSAHAPLATTTRLDMSAEELHAQRIQRSAQMGVQRAVDLQKDEMETEFKKRKLEGSDTKSKVSNLLAQLRQKKEMVSGRVQPTVIPSFGAPSPHLSTASSDSVVSGNASGSRFSGTSAIAKPSCTSAVKALSAPLAFIPSGLKSGGFVMTAAQPCADEKKSRSAHLEGQLSTTLLLRYVHPPLWEVVKLSSDEQQILRGISPKPSEARRRLAATLWAQPVREILHDCAAFGVVSSHQVYVLTEAEESKLQERLLTEYPTASAPQCEAILLSERVRVLFRFETSSGSFKAASAISASPSHWKVCFFPSVEYDLGHLGPSPRECWSQIPLDE